MKLLQYIRDEAHRFAQHYHHILRRKSQLEEDVKQGRRPPKRKKTTAFPILDETNQNPSLAAAPLIDTPIEENEAEN